MLAVQSFHSSSKVNTFSFDKPQKFSEGTFVVLANDKPWKTLLDNKEIFGAGFVDDYAPETGYLVKVQDESFWCKEESIKHFTGNPEFNLEAFTKGCFAIARNGAKVKFLKFDFKNITYQVLAEVNSSGRITHQRYSKAGKILQGSTNELDLVFMQNVYSSESINQGEVMTNTPKDVQELARKEGVKQETKEEIEKQLTELLQVQALESYWTEWFIKYLKSGVEIEEIENCSVKKLKDVVLKYSGKIGFKE